MKAYIKNHFGGLAGLLQYVKHNALPVRRTHSKLPSEIARVVFVCKGNICRSPLAERAFTQFSDMPTCSFGLDTTSGCTAYPPVVAAVKGIDSNIDLESHTTTSLADFQPKENDLYICMEPAQTLLLKQTAFANDKNILLLGLFSENPKTYIHDPYGLSDPFIMKSSLIVLNATKNLASTIKKNLQ